MTDKEKLQKLFEAALKQPEPTAGPPKRAFPQPPAAPAPVVASGPILKPAPEVSFEAVLPDPARAAAASNVEPAASTTEPEAPMPDDAASDELGALLDEQLARKSHKRKREALVTAIVLLGLTGGGFGWFASSPTRVQAFTSAIREIRSVTDVKSIVAKYQAALDNIGARSQQIDRATAAMGATKSAEDDKDPNMDAEMKQMMGGEGKTIGERNRALQAHFGSRASQAGGIPKPTAGVSEKESFRFN